MMRRTLWGLALGLPLAIACNEDPVGPAAGAGMRVRGVTLADWTSQGYDTPTARRATDGIAAVGANTIVYVVTYYQQDVSSTEVRADPSRTPSVVALEAAVSYARSVGLDVVIKPHVDVNTGAWRGHIGPADRAAWVASYRGSVIPLAEWANSQGVSGFVVGTELGGLSSEESIWRELIAATRSVFDGKVYYAASWDEADGVGFWDAVDAVTVDFYLPVALRHNPSRFEILAQWQPWLERLRGLHSRSGLPVILSEIGYRSVDGAGLRPYTFEGEGAEDAFEQADLYWAALQAVGTSGWMEGMWWWNWLATEAGGPGNLDYTPRGKPAEEELADAWAR